MIEVANRLHSVEEYYFSKKLKEVNLLKASGKPIINLGIGSPDIQPPTKVIKALQDSLSAPTAHKYQSYQGLPELREAISGFYKEQFHVYVNPNTEVLPLMGSKEGIMHISMAFLNAGDEVLVPNPGYPTYAAVTKLLEAKPVLYDLKEDNDWLPDFIAFGRRHNILIVNDNPYSFVLNEKPISIMRYNNAKDVCLELNSLSKTFNMAGWRVGMLVGGYEYIKAVLKVKSNMDSGMFYGIQKGAIEALKCSDMWFVSLNSVYQQRRKLVWELAESLNCTYDKDATGMFVWAKLPPHLKSEEFTDLVLKEHSIFITPGTVFGTNGEGYVRFSLCASEDEIKEAIARVK